MTVSILLALTLLAAPTPRLTPVTWKPAAGDRLLRDGLIPLGFSRQGAFAAIVEPADEACGCYFATFLILDLKTDAELFRVDYHSDEAESFPVKLTGATPKNAAEFWGAGEAFWNEQLTRHGIERKASKLERAEGVTADVKTVPESETIRGTVVAYTIVAKGPLGQKTIAERSFADAPIRPRSFVVVGQIRSPFEPRAVVVGSENWTGWEGPPHVDRVRLFGCHLKLGFKAPRP